VEGVEANGFQYMTGGVALVLGSVGANLGSGMTGGCVYLLDPASERLNADYVRLDALGEEDVEIVQKLLQDHYEATCSEVAQDLLERFDQHRFGKVTTSVKPEAIE
jgi:glutamate synthase domain-containing protein 3